MTCMTCGTLAASAYVTAESLQTAQNQSPCGMMSNPTQAR